MAKILIIVSHDRFQDEEFNAAFSLLKNSGHDIQIGSNHHTEARGHYGTILKPDVNIGFVETGDYDALVFIGGRGVEEYLALNDIHNLIRNFYYQRKIVAAIGLAVELFVYAGILAGKRVACQPSLINSIQGGGGYCTGKKTEIDSDIITATDERAKDDFAQTIAKALDHADPRRGLR